MMPDIGLRMDRDVVVLSAPLESTLASMGIANGDFELALLVESDTVEEAYRRALIAGASCLITPTGGFTRARLAHQRMENRAAELVKSAFSPLSALREQAFRPQHVLAEIGPCGLPLDVASSASIREHRHEYAALISLFEGEQFDGFLLNGFRRLGEMQPAIDAIRGQYPEDDVAIFASFDISADGLLADGFEGPGDVAAFAEEYGLSAVGLRAFEHDATGRARAFERAATGKARAFERKSKDSSRSSDSFDEESSAKSHEQSLLTTSVDLARSFAVATKRPLLVSIPIVENDVDLDALIETAELLHGAGVQFLRATGPAATSLHTAAIAGAVGGMPVVGREQALNEIAANPPDEDAEDLETSASDENPVDDDIPFTPIPEDLIARFSERVDAALRRQK